MSIFATDAIDKITDNYINRYCHISRHMSTGEAYSIMHPDGKRYTDYSDMFWMVFHRSVSCITLGLRELHDRSASHLKVHKHITDTQIIKLKKMFMQHLDESTDVLIFEGRHFHYFRDRDHENEVMMEFLSPMVTYICKTSWPICKYKNLIPNYIEG